MKPHWLRWLNVVEKHLMRTLLATAALLSLSCGPRVLSCKPQVCMARDAGVCFVDAPTCCDGHNGCGQLADTQLVLVEPGVAADAGCVAVQADRLFCL